jgi:vacuolar-type H+-ATPase subunit I/STV1
MSIGSALLLLAAGAILKWAVTAHVSGFDIQTAGTVLFVLGIVALPLALLYTFWWGPRNRVEERRVVREPVDRDVY